MKKSVRLQSHQADAVEKSLTNSGQILNWGLGSGKTLGSIAIAEKKGGNVLVVTPASLRTNFEKQLKQFVPRGRLGSYTIMSYEKFKKDPEGHVSRLRPQVLIADEVHRLRNPKPREPFERVRKNIPYMIGLTGSLINNRPEEMVPMVNLVAGDKVMGSVEEFKRHHIKRTRVGPGFIGWLKGVKPGYQEDIKGEKKLKLKTRGNVHRFTGSPEYRKHLPKVIERNVEVIMTPQQEKMYKALSGENPALAYKLRKNLPPSKKELQSMNSFMTAARQIMNNPNEYVHESKIPVIEASPKFKTMVEKMESRAKKDPNYRAVVYSNFLSSGIEPVVTELNRRGVKSEAFTGKLNDKQRRELVSNLNKGRIKILGLSPAGGEGLDLKGVKAVQLTEEHWNPERARQAIGRSARYKSHEHLPESERQVDVNRYISVHNPTLMNRIFKTKKPMSADQWIDERRKEKLELNNKFLNAIGEFEGGIKAAGLVSGMEKAAALALSSRVKRSLQLMFKDQGLPANTPYVVAAGSALYFHGLRPGIRDIDVHVPALPVPHVDKVYAGMEVDAMPTWSVGSSADLFRNSVVIDGVRVMGLKSLLAMKKAMNRPKDQADIEAIKKAMSK